MKYTKGPDQNRFAMNRKTYYNRINGEKSILHPKQKETLDYLLKGCDNKTIAEIMNIKVGTVKHHLTAIYKHYKVNSDRELLALFLEESRESSSIF